MRTNKCDCWIFGMKHDLVRPRKARPGDRIAVISPSFAAAGAYPDIHEQALRRLADVTGLVPVEYPTTRQVGATPAARAADVNAAFADPEVRAILTVIGGEDQITVIPHLDADLARADPKPLRSLGERGILGAVLVARPPVSDLSRRPADADRAQLRKEQRDTVVEVVTRYNPK